MEPTTAEQSQEKIEFPKGQLIESVPFQTYADSEGINAGGLKEVLRSPAHYYAARYEKVERKETPALQLGKLFHYAVLEAELFREKYVVQPKCDMRTNAGKLQMAEWKETIKPDAIIVPEQFVATLTGMAESILKHPISKTLLAKGVRETTIFWDDKKTGELCKARPDFITHEGYCLDLKTVEDARWGGFKHSIKKYMYHLQASHYLQAGRETKQYDPKVYFWLCIEKVPPYGVINYQMGEQCLERGDEFREQAMRIYAECKKKNVWPTYDFKAQVAEFEPNDLYYDMELLEEPS